MVWAAKILRAAMRFTFSLWNEAMGESKESGYKEQENSTKGFFGGVNISQGGAAQRHATDTHKGELLCRNVLNSSV